MVRIIMHGCNGKMGQVITGLVADDPNAQIVAGIDIADNRDNGYPVFTDIKKCDVAADVIVDFAAAVAVDALLDYSVEKQIPVVLCTTGLSDEQLAKVKECSAKVAILKSANMSLGINTLMKLLKDAANVFAPAGYDIEIVEKHHNQKVDAPSGTAIARILLMKQEAENMNMSTTEVGSEKREIRKSLVSQPFVAEQLLENMRSSLPESMK